MRGAAAIGRAPPEAEDAYATDPRALRLVLVLALDRAAVRACLGIDRTTDELVCPSTLYAWAAETAARSPRVWRRCARAIDEALAPWLAPYAHAPVERVAELLGDRDCATAMRGEEIAAALWALVRRRERALARLTEGLAAEAEALVTPGPCSRPRPGAIEIARSQRRRSART